MIAQVGGFKVLLVVFCLCLLLPITTVTSEENFYHEAPLLAAQVANGSLPSVAERLPGNPLVIFPEEKVGRYGGDFNLVLKPEGDSQIFYRTIDYDNLMRWDAQWLEAEPNIAQSVKVNDDATEYTFVLREGMRWSDGYPFTADDILFWYEGVYNSPYHLRDHPTWLPQNIRLTVIKVSDYEVVFRFAEPNGLFLQQLAHPHGNEPTRYPKHYLEQFHPTYNPTVNTNSWINNFVFLADLHRNPALPTLNAWILTEGYTNNLTNSLIAIRNPYYWKIDTDFNQLPYLDRIVFHPIDSANIEAALLNGTIDMQNYVSFDVQQQLLSSNSFRTYFLLTDNSTPVAISFNLTHPDPVLRGIFQNPDFRRGMSQAINRQRIIDEVFHGNRIPYQVAPRTESAFYNPALANQYLTYDVNQANAYLDAAGLRERDAYGWRLRRDGIPLNIVILYPDQFVPTSILAQVVADWATVGIQASIEQVTNSELFNQTGANSHDATAEPGVGGLSVVNDPRYYIPFETSHYGSAWSIWFTDPTSTLAQEPPEAVKQQYQLYSRLLTTSDVAEQNQIMRQILDIAQEQFYAIGIVSSADGQGLIRSSFHNIPQVMPDSWVYPSPAPTNIFQYYIDEQS